MMRIKKHSLWVPAILILFSTHNACAMKKKLSEFYELLFQKDNKIELTEPQKKLIDAIQKNEAKEVFNLIKNEDQDDFCLQDFLKEKMAPLLRFYSKRQDLASIAVTSLIRKKGKRYDVGGPNTPHFVLYDAKEIISPLQNTWHSAAKSICANGFLIGSEDHSKHEHNYVQRGTYNMPMYRAANSMSDDCSSDSDSDEEYDIVNAVATTHIIILNPRRELLFAPQKNGVLSYNLVISGKNDIRIKQNSLASNGGRIKLRQRVGSIDATAFPGTLIELNSLPSTEYLLKNRGLRGQLIIFRVQLTPNQE